MSDIFRNVLLYAIFMTLMSCCLQLDRIATSVSGIYVHGCK